MKRTQDNRTSLYPSTAHDERRALLREYLGEAEAARIEAEENRERKPLSADIRDGMRQVSEAREKARKRAALEAARREAGDFRADSIVWTECIDCLGDGGKAGPKFRVPVYEEVVRRHKAVVAANAGREKHQHKTTCMRLTWPDGRSIVFRRIRDARAALGIYIHRENLRHNKRLRGFTVEFGKVQ